MKRQVVTKNTSTCIIHLWDLEQILTCVYSTMITSIKDVCIYATVTDLLENYIKTITIYTYTKLLIQSSLLQHQHAEIQLLYDSNFSSWGMRSSTLREESWTTPDRNQCETGSRHAGLKKIMIMVPWQLRTTCTFISLTVQITLFL